MNQKGFGSTGIFLLIGAILITAVLIKQRVVSFNFSSNSEQSYPIIVPTPPPNPYNLGDLYKSGDEIYNYKFSIKLPLDWKARIKSDKYEPADPDRISITFIPPDVYKKYGDNYQWGGVIFTIRPSFNGIEDYLNDFVSHPLGGTIKIPNKREYYSYKTFQLGNKTVYQIDPSDKYPSDLRMGWENLHWVVLGSHYTYEIGGFNNAADLNYWSRLQKEVFPLIHFD